MPFSSTAFDELEALGALGNDEANELEPDHRLEEISLLRTKEAQEVLASSNDALTQRLRYTRSRTDLNSEKEGAKVAQTECNLCRFVHPHIMNGTSLIIMYRNREVKCDGTRTDCFQDHAVEQSCEYRQLPQESLSQVPNPPDGAEQRDFRFDIPKNDGGKLSCSGLANSLLRIPGGCWTCFFRKVKCDMWVPTCGVCTALGPVCELERPVWWYDAHRRQEQREINKLLIEGTKANSTESPFQRAPSPLTEAGGREFWGKVSEKDFGLRLKTDCNENIYTIRLRNEKDDRKGEGVAAETIATEEEQVS
jgi:hypothetical protein